MVKSYIQPKVGKPSILKVPSAKAPKLSGMKVPKAQNGLIKNVAQSVKGGFKPAKTNTPGIKGYNAKLFQG